MAKEGQIKVKDLKPDSRNANKHSDKGMEMLKDGIIKNGLGRSILISDDNEIIAGNGVTESAKKIGIENLKIIETDGSELIAIKRTDIKSGTKEFYEMALSDNIIAKENIIMDAEVVNAICEEYEIEDYKFERGTETDFSDKNKELSFDEEEKFTITLNYVSDEFIKVKNAIGLIGKTPEQILWEALELE